MLERLKKLLRPLGMVGIGLVAVTLLLLIALSVGGALVSLVLPGDYGSAAAFGYGVLVFLAALVLLIQAVRGKVAVTDSRVSIVVCACAGTVVGLPIVTTMLMWNGMIPHSGMDPWSVWPLVTVVSCSIVAVGLFN